MAQLAETYIPGVRFNRGFSTNYPATFGGNVTISGTLSGGGVLTNPVTSTSATALSVGPNGTTNPTFNIDASTANAATGLNIKSAAAGAGLAVSVVTSGTNENLTVDAAGSGTITLGSISTGNVITQRLLSSPKGITTTIPVAGNVAGITVVQNDTTNNPVGVTITNAGTGNGLLVTQTGNGLPLVVTNTGTSTGITVNQNAAASGLSVIRNQSNGANRMVAFNQNNASDPQDNLQINNAGTGAGIQLNQTGTGVGLTLTQTISSNSGIAPTVLNGTQTITAGVTDGFQASVRLTPTYSAATSQTVTRHNYLDVKNPTLSGAGPAVLTDAAVLRFDAAPGTHSALAANGSVATALTSVGPTGAQTTVQGWVKINVNGTLRYVPFF